MVDTILAWPGRRVFAAVKALSCILSVMDSNTLSNQADGRDLKAVPDWPDPGAIPDESDPEASPDGRGPEAGPDEREPETAPFWREPGATRDWREPGAMTYWRRRFVALTIGLGILSLIAWAFSGALGSGRGAGSTAGASHGHAPKAGTRSSGNHGAASPRGQPRTTAPGAAQPSAPPSRGAQGQAGHQAPAQAAVAAPHPARACKPASIVLSLFVGQDSYAQGQAAQFAVDVVSTADRTCGFNVGAKHLSLVVRAHGAQVWASTECAAGAGTLTANLTRGVPVIVPISWNQQTPAGACGGTGPQAPAGRYTASVSDGGAASTPVRFRLG
jgi:hypothetical protein